MNITPIAYFRSPLKEKFGVPRQSGIATQLHGRIVLQNEWNDPECLRGLEDFDYLWILWGFSANVDAPKHATVRPPRLGGNRRMGVFATRSSFRPNNIGMSAVRIVGIHKGTNVEIEVSGADLMDGTPIYDIKPYLPEFDSHGDAKAGFVDTCQWTVLDVEASPDVDLSVLSAADLAVVKQLLSQDPRPQYHRSPDRIYGMPYKQLDIRFKVVCRTAMIVGITDDCGQ